MAAMVMLAPPGTVERRYATALALRALAPGGALTILAPKDKGGSTACQGAQGLRLHGDGNLPPPSPHLRLRAAACSSLASTRPWPRERRASTKPSGSGRSPACSAGTGSIPAAPFCEQTPAAVERPRSGSGMRHRLSCPSCPGLAEGRAPGDDRYRPPRRRDGGAQRRRSAGRGSAGRMCAAAIPGSAGSTSW